MTPSHASQDRSGLAAFAASWPAKVRRLGDGERIIPTYKHRGIKGWWGLGVPLGSHGVLWYFYLPAHNRPAMAVRAAEKVLGHPVLKDASSDSEPYFWVPEADARVLMARGPRWCRVRRKRPQTLARAGGFGPRKGGR